MNPILIHHRSSHHASYSGYDQLVKYIDGYSISGSQKFLPYTIAKRIGSNINQNKGIYNSSSVYKDIRLFGKLFLSQNKTKVVHYFNAERDIRGINLVKPLFKNLKVCASFHKPPEVLLQEVSNNKVLKTLDGAIAVGLNQVDFLKDWLGINNVVYIPHGVDTSFFIPNVAKKKNYRLLFVGQHLRDFETLNVCIPILVDKIKNLKVDVVLRKDFYKYVKAHKAITMHSNISDLELKLLYQQANLLFLPLLNATACNSILEAMACGLPILTSKVGGNMEYLSETKNLLAPIGDNDYFIEQTLNLLKDESLLSEMGTLSREKALKYSWKIVANKLEDYYKTLK